MVVLKRLFSDTLFQLCIITILYPAITIWLENMRDRSDIEKAEYICGEIKEIGTVPGSQGGGYNFITILGESSKDRNAEIKKIKFLMKIELFDRMKKDFDSNKNSRYCIRYIILFRLDPLSESHIFSLTRDGESILDIEEGMNRYLNQDNRTFLICFGVVGIVLFLLRLISLYKEGLLTGDMQNDR